MLCWIYKWIISWSQDSDKNIPGFIMKHSNRCKGCREFIRLSTHLNERLTSEGKECRTGTDPWLTKDILQTIKSPPVISSPIKTNRKLTPVFAFAFIVVILVAGILVFTPFMSDQRGESVIAEIVYVIMKIYKKERKFTADVLKEILSLKGIVNRDKTQLRKALNIFVNQKVDIVDAILEVRAKQCLGVLSFDKDLKH